MRANAFMERAFFMLSRLCLIATLLPTSALAADPIATLLLDWNGDGYLDRATLEPSFDIDGRADLLLYQGTAEAVGSNLILVAPDFARAPTHPNMGLDIGSGENPGTFKVTETGTILDPTFWRAETMLRYADGIFFVDSHEMEQIPPVHQDNVFGCSVDFITKFAGGGNEALSDLQVIDADPIPLSYWTSSTFASFVDIFWAETCAPFEATYENFINTGNTIASEVALDWNDDGYTDRLVLFNTYSNPSLLIYMGDADGSAQLTWIARNLGPSRGERAALRIAPGMLGVVEVTIVARFEPEGYGKDDTEIRLIWNETEPAISRLTVWDVTQDSQYAAECTWYFDRGKFISDFTKKWVDEPDYAAIFSTADWENIDLDAIIYDCRP